MNSNSTSEIELDSPELKERALDAKIHIREVREKNKQANQIRVWKSCCFIINKEMCRFITQVGVLLSVIIYSMVAITQNKNPEVFGNLLTFCVGVLIPAPSLG